MEHPKTILVVDREMLPRWSFARRLAKCGGEVLDAADLEAARRIVMDREVHVVILDLSTLGDEGLLFMPFLRHTRPEAEVILLTGPEQIPLAIRGMKLGATDDLLVPVDVEKLVAKVTAALKRIGSGRPREKTP